ncbi:MAG: replication-associated recombination protein A [Bacteroidota bacterium]
MTLAYTLRPNTLDEFVGQYHLVGPGKVIRQMIQEDTVSSMIFWGPPGSGKTSLASIIAQSTQSDFYTLSAVTAGKEDLKKIIEIAKTNKENKKKTILFIDEVHRWNKAQQDVLLPYVESGLLILIGATTENPSFEVNSALLSRSRVFVLQSLEKEDLEKLITRALTNTEKELGKYKKTITQEAKDVLIHFSGGDARVVLNGLEIAIISYKDKEITASRIEEIFQKRSIGLYDKKGEDHYNTISAFIKSLRGSNVDGALYYLVRMLQNGEDPTFIARRMIIFASEDIGIADRGALIQANAGFEAVNKIGMPESGLILSHIAIYLATAKKSRSVANALENAQQLVSEYPHEPIPLHLRNAPTKLMKDLGYAKGYTWTHQYVGPVESNVSFLPEKIKNKKIFEP